ncbi:GH25 family lysozyme [Streptomyces oceani]|uniref:lysozyme n=1 Tax=Streptomyces oceani TaxID=1075402 RepID=A0A1E7KF92_9ACTN|nr:GH25 family lysozyme [Streptomyces oceani]OEV02591.1 lysozyme [Streptomyces oceani]
MHSLRPLGPLAGRRRAVAAAGALSAAMALLLTSGGTASAADQPQPGDKIKEGEAFMGWSAPKGPGADQDSTKRAAGPAGIDVSHWQGSINWGSVKNAGIDFAWMKATEGTGYKDPSFNSNYPNSHKAGLIRGAYHFARPDTSSGAAQANYFVDNGGAWSRDDQTLPGVLDIETNPYGSQCYGKSASQMRSWINDFYTTYKERTGRDMVIYTTASWWNACTNSWTGMADKSPLWVAHWTTGSPTIPAGFPTWTVWQYTAKGSVSGISGDVDRNNFNGSMDRLLALANNT